MFQRTHPIGRAAFTECTNVGPGRATLDIVVAREPARDGSSAQPWWRGVLRQPIEAPNDRAGIEAASNLLAPHGILLDTSDDAYDALQKGRLFALPSSYAVDASDDCEKPRSFSTSDHDLSISDLHYALTVKANRDLDRPAYLRQLQQENVYAVVQNTTETVGCFPAIAQLSLGTSLGAFAGLSINEWCAALGAGCGFLLGGLSAGMTHSCLDNAKARRVMNYYQELATKNLYAAERWDDALANIADDIKTLADDVDEFDDVTPNLARSFQLYRAAGAIFNTQEHKKGLIIVYTAKDRNTVVDFFRALDNDLLDVSA